MNAKVDDELLKRLTELEKTDHNGKYQLLLLSKKVQI